MTELLSGKLVGLMKLPHWIHGREFLLDVICVKVWLDLERCVSLIEFEIALSLDNSVHKVFGANFILTTLNFVETL